MNWLIVEDQEILLDALKVFLEPEFPGCKTFVALNGTEAIEILKNNEIDLVMTDVEMPLMGGLELVKIIKRERKRIKTIIYTMHAKPEYIAKAMIYESDAYVLKGKKIPQLVDIIKRVLNGETYFQPEALKKLEITKYEAKKLSKRQLEVAKLLGEGLSAKKVGEKLNLKENTVKQHRKSIYKILKIGSVLKLKEWITENNINNQR